jgi:hypothetical protein
VTRRGRARIACASVVLSALLGAAASPSLADVSAPPIASVEPSYPADTFIVTSSPTYHQLECNAGSWQSPSPITLAISWVRGAVDVGDGPSYGVSASDETLGIPVCRVTATNLGGQTTVTLPPVPTFPVDPQAVAYAVFGGTLIVRVDAQGHVVVPVSCTTAGASGCSGMLTLRRGSTRVGTGSFSVATVAKANELVTLAGNWRTLLAKHRLLDATLTLRNASGAYTVQPVVLDGRVLARRR